MDVIDDGEIMKNIRLGEGKGTYVDSDRET